jgi:pimeloyl-ACP methyl ester carboxylesterase
MFVHGSASDYRTWRLQQDEFSNNFRTITYSRRYHWPNAQISEENDYSMIEQVDDLQTLLRSLDAVPAHLVGHSYGAFLCLLLAIRAPHLVRTLVLAEPPVITLFVSDPPKPLEILKLLVSRPRLALSIIKFGAKGVAPASKAFRQGDLETGIRIFGDAVFGRGGYHRLSESRKEQVRANLSNVKAELLGPGFAPLTADQVRDIQAPAFLVSGQQSIGLFHHLTNRLEELLPCVERTQIRGASHLMHEDNAAAYNGAVLSWLARSNRPTASKPKLGSGESGRPRGDSPPISSFSSHS